jgi:hypothetical protein
MVRLSGYISEKLNIYSATTWSDREREVGAWALAPAISTPPPLSPPLQFATDP